MKKAILIILAFLLLVGAAACGENKDAPSDTAGDSSGGDLTEAATTGEADIYADLPDGSYDGYRFSILNSTSSTWAINTMSAESEMGETVNDAIFRRNLAVKDKLGIDIKVTDSTTVAALVRTQFQSQTGDFDCFFLQASGMTALVLEGALYDLNDIEEIDQSAVWWYPQTNGPLNFGNYTYMLLSDANLSFYESYYMVAFNKKLLESYTSMKNPYDMVYANEWTIDVMKEMVAEASIDLDSNSKMDTTVDQFGICGATNIGYSVMGSLDTTPLTYDQNMVPSFSELSERFISAYKKVMEAMYNPAYTANNSTLGYSSLNSDGVFTSGRGLFLVQVAGALKMHREDATDYGIVTIPKYDPSQERYMSTITPTGCSCVAVIANAKETGRIGTVVENLAAYSHKLLLPAYYDITLSYKYAKDETSIDMLNTIYQNGYLEVAYVYNFGSIRTTIQNLMVANSDTVVSSLQAIRKLVIRDIENAVAKLCN